jgi:thiamine-phosphate pyrophosphorylase
MQIRMQVHSQVCLPVRLHVCLIEPEPMPAFDIYLVTPPIDDAAAFRDALAEAVAMLKPASVLLSLGPGDERSQINRIKALAPIAQEGGAAVLVDAAPQIAVRGGADGVHATASDVAEMRAALGPDRIVGAGGLTSRHDAMDAGEAGVDYVMFGEPQGRHSGAAGALPALSGSALVERASWWAEIFETPCVAYAATPEMVAPLGFTKAEFVALGPWCFADPAAAARLVAAAREGVLSPGAPRDGHANGAAPA